MNAQIVTKLIKNFEDFSHEKDGVEFWFARDLQHLLEYTEWRKFSNVIKKAQDSCKNSGSDPGDHFVQSAKMVQLGSDSKRQISDFALTRYACYLIAQNGDSKKEPIAFAQSYFAVQTRKQELVEQRIKLKERLEAREKLSQSETELSKNIYERGVDDKGFARIRSKGDQALFGGNTTKDMKEKLTIPKKRPLADFLPTVTIAAKNFATEITNFNVKKDNLQGEPDITDEHIRNNSRVRGVLLEDDIVPEDLPAEEDIKKLQRRVEFENKLLEKHSKKKK